MLILAATSIRRWVRRASPSFALPNEWLHDSWLRHPCQQSPFYNNIEHPIIFSRKDLAKDVGKDEGNARPTPELTGPRASPVHHSGLSPARYTSPQDR
jgi:hypothetical protein